MIQSPNTTYNASSPGTAKYWIVQYVADPFRRETRNVGVIVQKDAACEARFFGEGETQGGFDNRTLRAFKHPKVYRQWVRYWKRVISESGPALEQSLKMKAYGNFQILDGGFIDRTGADSLTSVCEYAYSMLVSEGRLEEALRSEISSAEANVALRDAVAKAFRELHLLGSGTEMFRANPIYADQHVVGKKSSHQFSFIQSHQTLDLIEPLNLLTSQKRHARERAGWMAFAFNDVALSQREKPVKAFVLAELPEEHSDVTKYCLESLQGVATVVPWNDNKSRGSFLRDRENAAQLRI